MAVVKALEHFHKFLCGQDLHLHTDHSALTWLLSFKNLEGQMAHSVHHLQEYNFASKHNGGWKHIIADVLSEYFVQRHAHTARKSNDFQAAWKYELLLLLPQMTGTVPP
jgi:hypothetical protein